ncbi:VOC family protein [Amylibacter sp.]|jgi:hypothetical protein|nr:VOC family protein [Amylibacter sp.]MDB9857292.1 VOC family protein [Amylibacter sp.]
MIRIDHFALAATTLDVGVDYVRNITGLTVPFGGVHQGVGTHNCLMATGDDSYLEIIANDPNQPDPVTPRAFDLDNPDVVAKTVAGPHIQNVILRTDDAQRDVKLAREAGVDLGELINSARGDVHWILVLREDRTLALDGTAPPLIEWPEGPHISSQMADEGLILTKLTIKAPQADALKALFKAIDVQDSRLHVEHGDQKHITATYRTPDGRTVTLG